MLRFSSKVLIISLTFVNLLAQAQTITGTIIDAYTDQPIVGCEIIYGELGTVSDSDGYYSLNTKGAHPIVFRHIGYETLTISTDQLSTEVHLRPNILQGTQIQVVGALKSKSLLDSESSITVIQRRDLNQTSEPHFQKLIESVPNMNWAGGSSRPRYFQIRGVGERSQYAGDGPPNFSVGFSVDDLDLSGIGMAGLTFDMDRIELFRGPQSSIYGPNALAGFISLHSVHPNSYSKNIATLSVGNASTLNAGIAVNLITRESLGIRLAIYRGYNDGFRYNEFFDDKTTNKHEETMARLKINWKPLPRLNIMTTFLGADLNNGYDQWTPDNNGFTTYTDRRGKDSQALQGAVVRMEYELNPNSMLTSITTHSQAEMNHSYDSDWGNDSFWAQEPYGFDPDIEQWRYDFFDNIDRIRTTSTQEVRLNHSPGNGSLHYILGAYFKDLQENDDATGYLFGGDESDLISEFQLNNTSVYGQVEYTINPKITLTSNLRMGKRETGYSDDKGTVFSVDDNLNGGKFAFLYHLNQRTTIFANVARGFKAGGINQHPRILDAHRPFKPEYVNNYELGYRNASVSRMLSLLGFYSRRLDQQVSLSSQQDPTDPNSFTYFIGNASQGYSYGFELEFRQKVLQNLELSGSLGLLQSYTEKYNFEVAPDVFNTLGERAFAHAPKYSYRLGVNYTMSPSLSTNLSVSGKDKFYFSESHDQLSIPYELVNVSISYEITDTWLIKVWADNLLDKKYPVRGFYFGLEPPAYSEKLYMSYGDPRHAGLSLQYTF